MAEGQFMRVVARTSDLPVAITFSAQNCAKMSDKAIHAIVAKSCRVKEHLFDRSKSAKTASPARESLRSRRRQKDRAPSPEGPASLLIGGELARSGSALGDVQREAYWQMRLGGWLRRFVGVLAWQAYPLLGVGVRANTKEAVGPLENAILWCSTDKEAAGTGTKAHTRRIKRGRIAELGAAFKSQLSVGGSVRVFIWVNSTIGAAVERFTLGTKNTDAQTSTWLYHESNQRDASASASGAMLERSKREGIDRHRTWKEKECLNTRAKRIQVDQRKNPAANPVAHVHIADRPHSELEPRRLEVAWDWKNALATGYGSRADDPRRKSNDRTELENAVEDPGCMAFLQLEQMALQCTLNEERIVGPYMSHLSHATQPVDTSDKAERRGITTLQRDS
ncbi:hypothetical protein FA13DRAFT_1843934 [Coprinellus micaceus]|uniref:Uncharacterized protein n=1 Tax=Coprinellus micaceus TaxID=71717 RepID=A0A4Y7SDE8_COPMI|nr:hypothetical protein FA13DRAFT_1843934 [Coprinellus micaceus]